MKGKAQMIYICFITVLYSNFSSTMFSIYAYASFRLFINVFIYLS